MAERRPIPLLERMKRWSRVDPHLENDILAALEEGSTIGVAGACAGLTLAEMKEIRKWGREGRQPWDAFFRKMNRAMAPGQREACKIRKKIGTSPEASMSETSQFLEKVNPSEFGPQTVADPGKGSGITINLVKRFDGPQGAPAPALDDPDVVEGELVEEN